MAGEFIVDMTKVYRRKKRARREEAIYSTIKYKKLIEAGFTEREASNTVRNGIPLKDLKRQIKERKARVEESMDLFGWSRERAVREAEAARREWNRSQGIDLDNIMPEVSH